MATIELVILSSSPPKFQRLDDPFSNPMSSSPTRFPSPNALVRQKQTLRTGSRAAPMPSNATTSFTSPVSLLKPKPKPTAEAPSHDSIWDFPDDDVVKEDVAKTKEPRAKAAPKPRVKKPAVPKDIAEEKAPAKKARKPRAKKEDVEEGGVPVVKDKAVRKPRTKKADTEGQTKMPKGRVTKPSTGSTRVKETKRTAVVSAHFATTSSEFIDIDNISQGKALNLQKAAERRTDWTPPKATTDGPFTIDGITEGDADLDTTANGFTDLFGSFGHSKSGEPAAAPRPASPIPVRKRKLIELIKTNATMPSAQLTPKAKAVKKKPKTITEHATSAYALQDEENMEPAPLLQYFSRQDSEMEVSTSSKSRSRSPAKKPSKSKKAAPPPPTLLAPEVALEQAKQQEFIIGTSSQLAREDNPAFLRDLQQAMQLSNQLDDPFADDLPPTKPGSAISKSERFKPSLWEATSMIEQEGAKDIEILDFTNSSQVEKYFAKEDVAASSAGEKPAGSLPTPEADGDWYRLDDCHRSTQPDHPVATGAQVTDTVQADICSHAAQRKPSPIQASAATAMSSGKPMPSTSRPNRATEVATAVQRPDFESYSTSELAKEIASYKFKPIKKREQMIALLEKCWEGKQRTALGTIGSNTLVGKTIDKPPPSQTPLEPLPTALTSPTRPRGRPRKDSGTAVPSPKRTSKSKTVTENAASDSDTPLAARLTPKRRAKRSEAAVEEISDSDNPLTPSPPRRRASQIRSPPPLPLVTDAIDDAILRPLSPTSQERELFIHITAAVTTAPRTADPRRPSWYEKMLMYDPILLEDLTRWLNTEGLGRVGYDGEALAGQMKRWCQSKSVCCLFKENSRNGGVKKIGREA